MTESARERIEFLRRLRSTKAFTPEPVPDAVIDDIITVGRWTGSASNRQPWEVIVVRDPEAKRKMGEWGANPAPTAAAVFLIVSNSDAAAFDEGRLAERLNLAAAAHGLGSTVATLKGDGIAAAREYFGIPPDRRSFSVVAVGHVDEAVRRARPKNPQPRKPIEQFVHWDRF
ncbi:MAG TPA: nitroreductase family protein [Chloroflexota bacterium]|nr:nitroreductase family protein [Chloroflexota bacterium]